MKAGRAPGVVRINDVQYEIISYLTLKMIWAISVHQTKNSISMNADLEHLIT